MIVAIIQARMGSTRLPGKVAKLILGKSMLAHQIERVRQAKLVDKVVIATSDKAQDDQVEKIAKECGVGYFRGSEKDVLDRFYKTAKEADADVVIRLTGDCPLSDPTVIDEIINYFLENKADASGKPLNYPEGLDTEVLSFSALERAWKESKKPSEREHVTPYIINHPEIFKIKNIEKGKLYKGVKNVSNYHWSVDQDEDFKLVTAIFEELYPKNKLFLMNDILELLEKKPELLALNPGFTGYEGYQKSLKEDEEYEKNKK
ncbi:MAG TPA: glycosyltransferase family protein [Candidatus Paceibacterota bacterium]